MLEGLKHLCYWQIAKYFLWAGPEYRIPAYHVYSASPGYHKTYPNLALLSPVLTVISIIYNNCGK